MPLRGHGIICAVQTALPFAAAVWRRPLQSSGLRMLHHSQNRQSRFRCRFAADKPERACCCGIITAERLLYQIKARAIRGRSPLPPRWPIIPCRFADYVAVRAGEMNMAYSCYVYILRCVDGTFYTGWTTDLEHRLAAHNAGRGAKYTRARLPVVLVYCEAFDGKSAAMRRECAIKRMTRAQKCALIACGNEGQEGNRT